MDAVASMTGKLINGNVWGLGWPPGRFANGAEEPACPDQGDPENNMSEQRVPAS